MHTATHTQRKPCKSSFLLILIKQMKQKNLEQLNELAKENSFGGAHNAITCAVIYRKSYSECQHKYNSMKDILKAIKGILSKDLNELIDAKLKENDIDLSE